MGWLQRLKVFFIGEHVEYEPLNSERQIRRFYAQNARHLAAGLITNDAWEYAAHHASAECDRLGVDDNGIEEMHYSFLWFLYHDIMTYLLRGRHRLKKQDRQRIAMICLFVYSGQRYQQVNWRDRTAVEKRRSHWPFATKTDFDEARRHPPLLAGV